MCRVMESFSGSLYLFCSNVLERQGIKIFDRNHLNVHQVCTSMFSFTQNNSRKFEETAQRIE